MKYLIFETELGAKTRSAQETAGRGSNNTDVTRYWWNWRETASGGWALRISDEDVFNLSEAEQSALVDEVEWRTEEV